ncbi:hypothetical protein ISCGN_002433 [Ixodes scapularis]
MYQLFRSLAYIHSLGICHRDIKPQNLLLDPETGVLKLCDFGSAKLLIKGEPNVSYICSRYYRAPELIFGATDYTTMIATAARRQGPGWGTNVKKRRHDGGWGSRRRIVGRLLLIRLRRLVGVCATDPWAGVRSVAADGCHNGTVAG